MRSREQRIAQTVSKRARQLDVLSPGWWERITRPLDLQDSYECVLGQVYGEAGRSPYITRLPLPFIEISFLAKSGFCFATLSGLVHGTSCWYKEIQARRLNHQQGGYWSRQQAPDVIPEWMTEQSSVS